MIVKAHKIRIEPDVHALKPSFIVVIDFFAEDTNAFRIFDTQAEVRFKSGETTKKIGWLKWNPLDDEQVIKENFFALQYSLTLDHHIIECMDALRDSNDIELLFSGFLLIGTKISVITEIVSKIRQAGRKVPEDWKSTDIYRIERQRFGIAHTIPRSTWAEILNTIVLEEVRLIELRIPRQEKTPALKEAFQRLERAADRYRMGDYKGSMMEIREVIEIIESLKAMGERNLLSEAVGQRKFEKLKDLLAKIRDFCGIAGHEAQIGVEIYRSDARLAIEMVRGLLDYVNTALN